MKSLLHTYSHYTNSQGDVDGVVITFVEAGASETLEQEESRSQSLFYAVFKSTVNVMIIFDFDGNILDQNHVSPGLSFEDIKGDKWKQFASKESVSEIESRLKKVAATKETEIFEISVPGPDGKMVHYWNAMTPLEVEGGIDACLSTAVDVTELRNAQRAVEEQRDLIESINTTVPLLLYIFDVRTQANVFSNKDLVATLGYTRDEFAQFENGFMDIIHPDDLQDAIDHQKKISETKGEEVVVIESRMLNKSGEYRHFLSWDKCHLRDADVKVVQHIGASQDVTEMRKRDIAIAEKDKYYRTMFEGALDSLTIFDTQGNILDVNHQLYGWERESLIGASWKEVISFDDGQFILSQIHNFLSNEKPLAFELEIKTAKGRKRTFLNSLMSVEVAEGKNHILMATSDVTEVRSTQKALNESAKQKESLAQSNQDLEQFAYVASHDLQEPIRIVNQYLQLLDKHLGDDLDETSMRYMSFVMDASTQMRDLVNGLLEFARMNSQELKKSIIDINELIGTVVNFAELKINEVNATVTVGNFPKMICDPLLFRQLLQNLLSNALKFHDFDKPVEIEISYSSDKENHIVIIEDNGIGVKKELVKKMFLIFQRGHSKEKYMGHGIGLTLCKQIVERHGGAIWVDSELGKGTQIRFSIPKDLEVN